MYCETPHTNKKVNICVSIIPCKLLHTGMLHCDVMNTLRIAALLVTFAQPMRRVNEASLLLKVSVPVVNRFKYKRC